RALLRGGARARHRRVDEVDPARGEARIELAREGDRRGAEIDDIATRPQVSEEVDADFLYLRRAREREEDELAALGDLAHARRALHSVRREPLERLGGNVVRVHRLSALRRHVTTDGL